MFAKSIRESVYFLIYIKLLLTKRFTIKNFIKKIKINDLKVLLDRLKKVGDLTKLGANFYVDVFLAIIDQVKRLKCFLD